MAVTPTTLFDGSRGYVIDPEPAYTNSGATITGGRFYRDETNKGDDLVFWNGSAYVTNADGRKERDFDGRETARRDAEYVKDGVAADNAS